MENKNNQEDTQSSEHSSFYDQADGNFNKAIQNNLGAQKLAKGVTSDKEGEIDPEDQVRETENASLQDDSYSFDEENTDNEEYHDAGDGDFDLDNDDDYVQ
jgi:hypothetical protein